MNYFGHAAIASERRHDPDFVLGAMLPDLAGMLRTACPDAASEPLRAGLAFHLETDAVFHDCPTFSALNLAGLRALRLAGVGRGPARAAAHLGTELLLDSVLVARDAYAQSYLEALRRAQQAACSLIWSSSDVSQSFLGLAAHLLGKGCAIHEGDPERIGFRLARALEGRPRLEPTAAELSAITHWLHEQRPRVTRAAEPLLAELRRGLAAREKDHSKLFPDARLS